MLIASIQALIPLVARASSLKEDMAESGYWQTTKGEPLS
jgi:hypothetical protein